MQNASKEYKEQLKKPLRRREYIKVSIGVINQKASEGAYVKDTKLIDWSANDINNQNQFSEYATPENNFSRVDGSMSFLPRNKDMIIYRNGIVSEKYNEPITFGLDGTYNIKGLKINFGTNYPTKFKISNGQYEITYDNNSAIWSTEDIFTNSIFIEIIPVSMKYQYNRLRIYEITFGAGVVFNSKDVINFSSKTYTSPIAETIPSFDMTIDVANYNMEYNVDDPKSTINFLEKGQVINVSFGQELDDGSIEWINAFNGKLDVWYSDDSKATFSAIDGLSEYTEKYYKGMYRVNGISAYDLGLDILQDMNCNKYYLDSYLKHIFIKNPMPVVTHTQALQILANACRCALSISRDGEINIQADFIPELSAESADISNYSKLDNIFDGQEKQWYGISSSNFTLTSVNSDMYFMPKDNKYNIRSGYISNQVADCKGIFTNNPKLTIIPEAPFKCFSMQINFQSVFPEEFIIKTYLDNTIVDTKIIKNVELNMFIMDEFKRFDKMIIEFTKGYPESPIAINYINFGDVTDYELTYSEDLLLTPKLTHQDILKTLSVVETIYTETNDTKKIFSGAGIVSPTNNTITVNFTKPSYDLSVICKTENINCKIIKYSNYFATVAFDKLQYETTVEFAINGKEYLTSTKYNVKKYNDTGSDYEWNNPLIDNDLLAMDMQDWLSAYYSANAEYDITYRGDPRIDSSDLVYLELKDRSKALVKLYQSSLTYNGAWKGTLSARKVKNIYKTWNDVNIRYTWNSLYASGITWSRLKARI